MKFVNKIIVPIACMVPIAGISQMRGNCAPLPKVDTLWFDIKWKVTNKANGYFYRIYTKTAGGYNIWDRYRNHSIQMTAFSTTVNPLFKEGSAIYYNHNGFLSSVQTFRKDYQIGKCRWYYKNETDSSVAFFDGAGKSTQLHAAKSFEADANDGFGIQQIPVLEQGVPNMHDVIAASVVYPAEAKKNSITGKTVIAFTVLKNGSITDVKVSQSSGKKYFDDEAVRVVKLLPKFIPGKNNGVPVDFTMVVPVSFPFH